VYAVAAAWSSEGKGVPCKREGGPFAFMSEWWWSEKVGER